MKLDFSATDPEDDDLFYKISWDEGDWFSDGNYLINQSKMDFQDSSFQIYVTVSDGEFELKQVVQIDFLEREPLAKGVGVIEFYPNPVSERLFICGIANAQYVIWDLFGKKMQAGYFNSIDPIDVQLLPRGQYILSIIGSTFSHRIKFIKE